MSAHDSFVIGTATLSHWLVLLILLETSWIVSHLVKATSSTLMRISSASLAEVLSSPTIIEPTISSHTLLASTTSEASSSTPSITSAAPSWTLVTVVPLDRLESQIHKLL